MHSLSSMPLQDVIQRHPLQDSSKTLLGFNMESFSSGDKYILRSVFRIQLNCPKAVLLQLSVLLCYDI